MSPIDRLNGLGGLHDARVALIAIDFVAMDVRLELANFYANFCDPGGEEFADKAGAVVFASCSDLEVKISNRDQAGEDPWVSHIVAKPEGDLIAFEIWFYPGGSIVGKAKGLALHEPEGARPITGAVPEWVSQGRNPTASPGMGVGPAG